jgi:endonuclease YncB( thermonuclease family)
MGRQMPAWVFVLILLAAVTAVTGTPYAVYKFSGQASQNPIYPEVKTQLPLPPGKTLSDLTQGDVYDVIDGDTIEVLIDHKLEYVRYYGVDTPEKADNCYIAATERNRDLVGSHVLLLPDARDRDEFGRLLRYVFKSDGTSVDATLVAEGLGHAWLQDGQYKSQIVTIEGQAQGRQTGCLWKN